MTVAVKINKCPWPLTPQPEKRKQVGKPSKNAYRAKINNLIKSALHPGVGSNCCNSNFTCNINMLTDEDEHIVYSIF